MSPKPPHMGTCFGCGYVDKNTIRFHEHITGCEAGLDVQLLHRVLGVVENENGCLEVPGKIAPKTSVGGRGSMRAWLHLGHHLFGETPKGKHLCHRCDNKRCLNPDHFYIGTPSQNGKDAWRNGRRSIPDGWADAMAEGRRNSEKAALASARQARTNAHNNRGENHWTKRDPEKGRKWKEAISAGRDRYHNQKGR